MGDAFIEEWTSSIPRTTALDPKLGPDESAEEGAQPPQPRYRPPGDPDNLTFKEAGEILGKARNTLYLWYRKGNFPPAVDVSPYMPDKDRPVIVVPLYRLEAWQAGERMPHIFQAVFEKQGLHEPPWVCYLPRKRASRNDLDFWVERRGLLKGRGKGGKRIYGEALEEGKVYEPIRLFDPGRA